MRGFLEILNFSNVFILAGNFIWNAENGDCLNFSSLFILTEKFNWNAENQFPFNFSNHSFLPTISIEMRKINFPLIFSSLFISAHNFISNAENQLLSAIPFPPTLSILTRKTETSSHSHSARNCKLPPFSSKIWNFLPILSFLAFSFHPEYSHIWPWEVNEKAENGFVRRGNFDREMNFWKESVQIEKALLRKYCTKSC